MTSFSYPLAQSYIADITEPSKLSQAYGLFQVRSRPTQAEPPPSVRLYHCNITLRHRRPSTQTGRGHGRGLPAGHPHRGHPGDQGPSGLPYVCCGDSPSFGLVDPTAHVHTQCTTGEPEAAAVHRRGHLRLQHPLHLSVPPRVPAPGQASARRRAARTFQAACVCRWHSCMEFVAHST